MHRHSLLNPSTGSLQYNAISHLYSVVNSSDATQNYPFLLLCMICFFWGLLSPTGRHQPSSAVTLEERSSKPSPTKRSYLRPPSSRPKGVLGWRARCLDHAVFWDGQCHQRWTYVNFRNATSHQYWACWSACNSTSHQYESSV